MKGMMGGLADHLVEWMDVDHHGKYSEEVRSQQVALTSQ